VFEMLRIPRYGRQDCPSFPSRDGCTQSSRAEAEVIAELVRNSCTHRVVRDGKEMPITLKDILIVAPYNRKRCSAVTFLMMS
jgi:hypothetical protein